MENLAAKSPLTHRNPNSDSSREDPNKLDTTQSITTSALMMKMEQSSTVSIL